MAATASDGSRTLEALKRLRPKSLRVHLADGTKESVAVPTRHRKWKAVESVLSGLRWVQVDALNDKGEIIGVFDNDAPAEDLEDLEFDAPQTGQLAKLAQLFLHGQDMALRRHEKLVETMLNINLKLSDVLMSRLDTLEKSYQANLKELQKLTLAGDAEGDELMSTPLVQGLLMKAAMSQMGGGAPGNSNPVE